MNVQTRRYGATLVLALLTASGAAAQEGAAPNARRGVSAAAREGSTAVRAARGDQEAQAEARAGAREGLEAARGELQERRATGRPEEAGRPDEAGEGRGRPDQPGAQGTPEARAERAAEREAAADARPNGDRSRREEARGRRWQEVREQTGVARPEDLPEPARDELRTHARREARLQAIRARAVEANDTETVGRVDAALEREAVRHRGALRAAAARARGDEQPNERAADGQAEADSHGPGAANEEDGE